MQTRGSQVVVVPLRVNVNLKAVTLEDLLERRKAPAPPPFPLLYPTLRPASAPPPPRTTERTSEAHDTMQRKLDAAKSSNPPTTPTHTPPNSVFASIPNPLSPLQPA